MQSVSPSTVRAAGGGGWFHVRRTRASVESLANDLAVGENSHMPTITFSCGEHTFERQFSIMKAPPSRLPCKDCDWEAERVWEAPEFICDRADQDHNHVPEQFRVSDRVRPETKEEGARMEKAIAQNLQRSRREHAGGSKSSIKKDLEIPAHLYHGKIRETGDKSYWLQQKNKDKHKEFKVTGYGRSGRGKG